MIGWIRRNDSGIVQAFCAVEYADRDTLDELRECGPIELVEAERITLNMPLGDHRVLMKLDA